MGVLPTNLPTSVTYIYGKGKEKEKEKKRKDRNTVCGSVLSHVAAHSFVLLLLLVHGSAVFR